MFRWAILFLLFTSLVSAQSKSSPSSKTSKKNQPAVQNDTVEKVVDPADTIDQKEAAIRAERKFAVYSKRGRTKTDKRLKLCIQLLSWDTVLTYCVNDSLTKDPEVSKILFEKTDGDTTYVLVFVDAFTKVADKPACDAGHETKLFFGRWNPTTNKAIWKQKTISSCMRGITNMTKQSIASWDQTFPLIVNYHRGGSSFIEITFDPNQYKLGLQTTSDTDSKSAAGRE